MTGLPKDQVSAVLTRLVGEGALLPAEVEAASAPPAKKSVVTQSVAPESAPPQLATPQLATPQSTATQSTATQSTATQSTAAQSTATQSTATESTATQSTATESTATESTATESTATQSTATQSTATPLTATRSPETDADDPSAAMESSADGEPLTPTLSPLSQGEGATHLALYRSRFHPLPSDQRVKMAAISPDVVNLSALCFDPLPSVIQALMDNTHTGLEQARLIAAHHHNSAGLEFLLARADLMRDTQVQRLLWRNPQLNEGQLRRLTQSKRLLDLWKLSVSRETTSQTRTNTARLLRTRWATAPGEERVELIFSTEGRALAGLSGLAVDGKTTSLLCARTYASMLLVQNLAHWSATPPALIAHLLRQPLVVRQPRLRTILSHHPNAPPEAKRSER